MKAAKRAKATDTDREPSYLTKLEDMTQSCARFCAKWWADHIRQGTTWNNGDALHGAFAGMLDKKLRDRITPQMVDRFEALLFQELYSPTVVKDYELKDSYGAPRVVGAFAGYRDHMSVDYHPAGPLRDALTLLDKEMPPPADRPFDAPSRLMDSPPFPCKTNLRVTTTGVDAGVGYGSAFKTVWSTFEPAPLDEYKVVNRWVSADRYTTGWSDACDIDERAELAWMQLEPCVVAPRIQMLRLKGIVKVDRYGDRAESAITYAMSQCAEPGYLALVVRR